MSTGDSVSRTKDEDNTQNASNGTWEDEDGEADASPFPWHLGIFDAHCHPTDTVASLATIPTMRARALTVMATRPEDQDLVAKTAQECGVQDPQSLFSTATTTATIQNGRAEQQQQPQPQQQRPCAIIPSFGWHPWFSHKLYDDITSPPSQSPSSPSPTPPSKQSHYTTVLTRPPSPTFLSSLPPPTPFSTFLSHSLTPHLSTHPHALVGEIGLDRSFRLPAPFSPDQLAGRDEGRTPGGREGRRLSPYRVKLEHQKCVLREQLRVAGREGRAVSVHCVGAQGAVWEVLEGLWRGWERRVESRSELKKRRWRGEEDGDEEDGEGGVGWGEEEEVGPGGKEGETENGDGKGRGQAQGSQPRPFPPRICMHSYSGAPEPLRQFLHPSVPTEIYFSFSQAINFDGSESSVERVEAVIRALPERRILVESDLHCAGEVMDGCLEEGVRRICRVRGWGLEEGVRVLGGNWRRFVFGEEGWGG